MANKLNTRTLALFVLLGMGVGLIIYSRLAVAGVATSRDSSETPSYIGLGWSQFWEQDRSNLLFVTLALVLIACLCALFRRGRSGVLLTFLITSVLTASLIPMRSLFYQESEATALQVLANAVVFSPALLAVSLACALIQKWRHSAASRGPAGHP